FHEREWRLDQAMIRLNVMALTELTRRLLPGMVERGRGRVLNVASVAGFLPGPLQAVYFATKAYVVSLSEALAHELRGTGVTVTALCPGATATEFAERAGLEDALGFKVGVASAASVARAGYRGMERGRTLVVPGFQNALLVRVLLRLAPRSLAARVAARFNRR
ncbi:MAG: SDR family NAD(P)-dependent oxidoreductase, partial [Gemmatimonadetes bacterium]